MSSASQIAKIQSQQISIKRRAPKNTKLRKLDASRKAAALGRGAGDGPAITGTGGPSGGGRCWPATSTISLWPFLQWSTSPLTK